MALTAPATKEEAMAQAMARAVARQRIAASLHSANPKQRPRKLTASFITPAVKQPVVK